MAGNTLMKLLVSLGLDSKPLKDGLGESEDAAKKSASKIQQSLKSISDKTGKLGTALSIGVTAPLVAFGAASVQAAMDSESAMAELQAVIKSTGGVAGVTAKQVTDYATAMQKVTKFDDEAIIGGQSMLLTFTKIGKDVFPAASTAMLNMAEKFGSVDQAAIQLGKALNDPVQGVGALRRVGVALSDQQEQQIKDFMAVGDVASAQKIILKELETEFGGLAEAAGATNQGKLIQFKNALGDLQEVVGTALLPHLISLTNGLRGLIDGFNALPPGMQKAIIGFGVLLASIGPVLNFISLLATAAAAFAPGGALAGMGVTLAGVGTALSALLAPILVLLPAVGLLYLAFKTNFGGISDTVNMIWQLFSRAWGEEGILGVLKMVGTFISLTFQMQWESLINTLRPVADWVGTILVTAMRYLTIAINWVIAAVQNLQYAFSQLKIPSWLTPGSPTPLEIGLLGINQAAKTLTSDGLSKMANAATELGKNWLMNSGFSSGAAGAAMSGAVNNVKAWIALQISMQKQSIESAKNYQKTYLTQLGQYYAQMALMRSYYAAQMAGISAQQRAAMIAAKNAYIYNPLASLPAPAAKSASTGLTNSLPSAPAARSIPGGGSAGMTVNLHFGDAVTRDEVHNIANMSADSAAEKLKYAMGMA